MSGTDNPPSRDPEFDQCPRCTGVGVVCSSDDYEERERCPRCDGWGSLVPGVDDIHERGQPGRHCQNCGGTGVLTEASGSGQDVLGIYQWPCPTCGGYEENRYNDT